MIAVLYNLMCPSRPAILSELDLYRLYAVIDIEKSLGRGRTKRVKQLRKILRSSNIYPVRWFPIDTVTLNTDFEITCGGKPLFVLRLVYPSDACRKEKKISVLSSLGMRVLGRKSGDDLGHNRLAIGRILYQPEFFDNFSL